MRTGHEIVTTTVRVPSSSPSKETPWGGLISHHWQSLIRVQMGTRNETRRDWLALPRPLASIPPVRVEVVMAIHQERAQDKDTTMSRRLDRGIAHNFSLHPTPQYRAAFCLRSPPRLLIIQQGRLRGFRTLCNNETSQSMSR